jgi:hypothetical protein
MTSAPFRLAFAVFVMLSASAHAKLSVFPRSPTTDTPVILRGVDNCARRPDPSITRNGAEIRVALSGTLITCPGPFPLEIPFEVRLGRLPAGRYHVTLLDGPRGEVTFSVRNAEPTPYTLHPWAIPTYQGRVPVQVQIARTGFVSLCGIHCDQFRIQLGNGPVYRYADLVGDKLTVPVMPPGPVDVRITTVDGTFLLPSALYYYDPSAPADPFVFDRVLFPVFFNADGAFGSRWRSEAVTSNPNPWEVRALTALDPVVCIWPPCLEQFAPGERRKEATGGFPRGLALLIPRDDAETMAFSLRIRDISREADNLGVQVPVVRERDMFRNTDVTLLDVPLDPRYRTKVRVYVYPDPIYTNDPTALNVRFRHVTRETQTVALSRSCDGTRCEGAPFYGELDLAAGAQGEHADLYVELPEGAFGWAFASVTNNATQQVTIVAPDGRGGNPCLTCD